MQISSSLRLDQSDQSQSIANGILDANKTQTVLTSTSKNQSSSAFMSPIGTLQLTPEECNEILLKRAAAAAQQQNTTTNTNLTTSDGQHSGTRAVA